MEFDRAGILRFQAGLLGHTARGAADVKGAHRELRSRFADGLCCNDTDGLADFNQLSGCEIPAVAADAGAAPRFTRQYGANFDAFDAGGLDRAREVFRNLLIDLDDHVAFVVFNLLERHTADDAVS